MAAAIDMLEVEARLEAGTSAQPVDNSSEAGLQSTGASSNGAAAGENFYSSSKGGTWKKFKKMVKHKKEGSSEVGGLLYCQPLLYQHTSFSMHTRKQRTRPSSRPNWVLD